MGAPSFIQAVSIAMTGLPSRSGAASMKRPRSTSTMRRLERQPTATSDCVESRATGRNEGEMGERAKCSRWQYIFMAREPACLA
eukprot:3546459-Pleurochrysis_carterae.AAC.1